MREITGTNKTVKDRGTWLEEGWGRGAEKYGKDLSQGGEGEGLL